MVHRAFWLGLGLLLSPLSYATQACISQTEPERVFGANPVVTYLIMAIAPEKLVGWNFTPPPQAKGVFSADSFDKPIIGGWFGQGQTPNIEALIKTRPDLAILSGATVDLSRQTALTGLGLPVCTVKLDALSDYPLAIRQMGTWLHREQKAQAFATLAEHLITQQAQRRAQLQAQNIPIKTVYYAQSPSGLETECVGSIHAEVIPLAGGKNPHYCPADAEQGSRFGKVSISFEQLMRYNPDAIVTQENAFYDKVYQDTRWRNLKAVQNKQVFLMPQAPFRWMDRPPSYMRLLAMQWLMAQLYPEQTDIDMNEQVRGFFKQVFDADLNEDQIARVLQGGLVDE
ncbi:MAG: ABC transporter substrate-binding protein [Thiomicrospira sp.]